MIIGLVSLGTLVGCGQSASAVAQTESNGVEAQASETQANEAPTSEQGARALEEPSPEPSVSPEPSAEPEKDLAEQNKQSTVEQIQDLASLIGKKADEVDAVLGEPSSTKNLEKTDILLVRYYKVDYLDEMAKVEAIFNDDEQVVNFVSFFIPQANDIEATKENLFNTLTELYGESTIERYLDVQGRLNRNWTDGTLTYELTYIDDNIVLDIYPVDK